MLVGWNVITLFTVGELWEGYDATFLYSVCEDPVLELNTR